MKKDGTWHGWIATENVTIQVDNEEVVIKKGEMVPAHIVAGFPRSVRETKFVRNYALRGDVKAS